MALAESVHIVTVASPSTVDVWCTRLSPDIRSRQIAVAIGPTSEQVARSSGGFAQVTMPVEGSKGIEAWANAVKQAIASIENRL